MPPPAGFVPVPHQTGFDPITGHPLQEQPPPPPLEDVYWPQLGSPPPPPTPSHGSAPGYEPAPEYEPQPEPQPSQSPEYSPSPPPGSGPPPGPSFPEPPGEQGRRGPQGPRGFGPIARPLPGSQPQPRPLSNPLPAGITPIVSSPNSVASDDQYAEIEDHELPEDAAIEPAAHLPYATSSQVDHWLGQWEKEVLRDAATWHPIRSEPFGGIPHKALPDFKDPRWTSVPAHSYVPYWTSPYWSLQNEEDWRGGDAAEYMERRKLKDREHELRPAILRHPVDESVVQSDYALYVGP